MEEMRRVRQYFEWKTSWWKEGAGEGRDGVRNRVKEGCIAYAYKQVAFLNQMREKFTSIWLLELKRLGLPIDHLITVAPVHSSA